ncbi:MAG: hypothetical protein R2877_07390 [Bdellovibrionota bacterium]
MKNFIKKFRHKPVAAKPGEINYVIFDRFTLVHFLIGCVYAYCRLKFWAVLALAIIWELVENPLKAAFPSLFPVEQLTVCVIFWEILLRLCSGGQL